MQLRIKKYQQHIVVKKLISVFILGAFLLSITPKQVLHNLVAAHTDNPSGQKKEGLQLNMAGFHCDCNSIVATSPFTDAADRVDIGFSNDFIAPVIIFSSPVFSNKHFYFELRGPPTA